MLSEVNKMIREFIAHGFFGNDSVMASVNDLSTFINASPSDIIRVSFHDQKGDTRPGTCRKGDVRWVSINNGFGYGHRNGR